MLTVVCVSLSTQSPSYEQVHRNCLSHCIRIFFFGAGFLLLLLNLNKTSVPGSEVYKFPFSNIEMMYLQTSMQNG